MKDILENNKIYLVIKNYIVNGNLETEQKAFFKEEDAKKEFDNSTNKEIQNLYSYGFEYELDKNSFFMWEIGNACWNSVDIHIATVEIQ